MKSTYYLKPNNGAKSFNNRAVVVVGGDTKELYSYNTLVCTIKGNQYKLNRAINKDLLLSATTLKHIKAFLYNELGIDNLTKKDLKRGL